MRLDRFLTGQTALSRKDADRLIRSGAVTVGGVPVRQPQTQISPEADTVCLSGQPVIFEQYRYYLLHKPPGILTAARDRKQKTVLDLLADEDRRRDVMPVGRLDLDTAGLLLLTDDGQLAHRLLAPKSHVQKFYLVTLRDPVTPDTLSAIRSGMTIREGAEEAQCLPASCETVSERLAVLELHEGKYHQVKRMFAACGNHVEKLLRVQLGGLQLPPELPAGQYRKIYTKEIASLHAKSDIFEVCAFCMQHYSSYWIKDCI